MKIMLCASMKFAQKIKEIKEQLEQLGHTVAIPVDTEFIIENPDLPDDLKKDHQHLQENNVLKQCFDLVANSDAIFVLNYEKNSVKGYIGTSVLMEIGLAHYLGKKIFLLNNVPPYSEHRWAHEIYAIAPIILNGDLTKINS